MCLVELYEGITMARKNQEEDWPKLDDFTIRILICLSQERLFKSEVRIVYLQRHPPGFPFRNKPLLTLSQRRVNVAIDELMSYQFIRKELVRWHNGEPLRQDTPVYVITSVGIQFLNAPKK